MIHLFIFKKFPPIQDFYSLVKFKYSIQTLRNPALYDFFALKLDTPRRM